jgi:hypothetical protein
MRVFVLSALLIGGLSLLSGRATAADLKVSHGVTTYPARAYVLPFPRSDEAQSVWASTACWQDCGRECAWGLTECVRHDRQRQCLEVTDRCDRFCQRTCRTRGGPYLAIE